MLNLNDISLHDAEIISLNIDRHSMQVSIFLKTEAGQRYQIHISDVHAFRVEDMSMQNVISHCITLPHESFNPASCRQWIEWATSSVGSSSWLSEESMEKWMEDIRKNHLLLIALIPSAGAQLCILFKKLEVITLN